MFENTLISKEQWMCIMKVDVESYACDFDPEEIRDTLQLINQWVEQNILDGKGFLVIGV